MFLSQFIPPKSTFSPLNLWNFSVQMNLACSSGCRVRRTCCDALSPSLPKQLECQDALETAARAEGLSLDVCTHSQLRILDEEHPKGKYHHSLSALKPIRTTSK